jgi:hypothetical protein
MPCGRRDGLFRTLRFRLTFWNTGAILVLVLATLVGVREGLRYTLRRERDALLAEDVLEVGLILERYHPDWGQVSEELARKARSHRRHGWYVRVFSADGARCVAGAGAPDVDAPPVAATPPGPFDVGDYRVLQRRLGRPGLQGLVVRVGSSRAFVAEDLFRLTQMMLVAVVVLLVAAPLGGYWLAGRATWPLATILETTARLHPDRLVERLPLRGSGDELDRLSATINGFLDRLADHLER